MYQVYAILDLQRSANIRSCTSSHAASSSTQWQASNDMSRTSQCFEKRRMQDQDSSPPGDGNGKRRRKERSKSNDYELGRQLACPFYKYDPRNILSIRTQG
ncbi:hypothetical protein N7G274_006490 [Stereocaulon virgatum]|uniref:Uncharacterized protein n=1 Tax=Stereocaulon virgatum TaxID=373712 RepID=A0ABR4A580_9LECA